MENKVTIEFKLNGAQKKVATHPMMRLLDVVRESCHATGTKEGCGEGECGACSVFIDGVLVNSCLVPIGQVAGRSIKTVESMAASDGTLSALQRAFIEHNGAQCGICTPGMLMAAQDLLQKNRNPSLKDIQFALAGNLCRCTGYTKIFDAVMTAARYMREGV